MIEEISRSINNLSNNISNVVDGIKNIGNFFNTLGSFFNELIYLLANPSVLFQILKPWIIFLLMILVILKIIGFKTGKWIRLFLIVLITVTIF